MPNQNEELESKKRTSKKAKTRTSVDSSSDDFDDEFEKLEIAFPPIYSFAEKGDSLIFIPRGTSEGPNGTLILCELVKVEGEGEFVLREEAFDLTKGDNFALGVKTIFIGDNKLVTAAVKGQLSPTGVFCNEQSQPIKLIYNGKVKSTASKFSYSDIEIHLTKRTLKECY